MYFPVTNFCFFRYMYVSCTDCISIEMYQPGTCAQFLLYFFSVKKCCCLAPKSNSPPLPFPYKLFGTTHSLNCNLPRTKVYYTTPPVLLKIQNTSEVETCISIPIEVITLSLSLSLSLSGGSQVHIPGHTHTILVGTLRW